MEDSGKEKLQGQKSAAVDAQNSAKQSAAVEFDSAKIGKNKKEEQFKNIEGVEERAKAAEKAKQDAAKAVEKQQEKAEKARKKAEITPQQKKAKAIKIAIAVVVAVLVLVCVGVFAFLKYKETHKSEQEITDEVVAVSDKAKEIKSENSLESYAKSKEYFQEQIEQAKDPKVKFNLALAYIGYLMSNKAGYNECLLALEYAESLAIDADDLEDMISRKCSFGVFFQDDEFIKECDNVDGSAYEEWE